VAQRRKRIEYVLGPLGAAATAVFFAALIFVPWANADKEHRFIRDRIGALVSRQGINPVELTAIADYPVDRVCFGYEYSVVSELADAFGATVDISPDARVPESSYALFLIGTDGSARYGSLFSGNFVGPTQYGCRIGGRLAIQFDDTYPLGGGRLVDLDAPDLQPTMIE